MTTIYLNPLKERAFNNACEHGFHNQEHPDEHWLMLVITELSEAIEADRKNLKANLLQFDRVGDNASKNWTSQKPYSFPDNFRENIKNSIEDELTDVVIRLLDLAGLRNIDLASIGIPVRRSALANCMTVFCYDVTQLLLSSAPLSSRIHAAISWVFEKCDHDNIDLLHFISLKMNYNETREDKHGKKY